MNSSGPISPASALRSAAHQGDLFKLRHLAMEGVDINIWDKNGYTALTYAAEQGHLEIVSYLLENGAWVEPHEDYDTYNTPLMVAVQNGHFEVVKKLIESRANPTWHVGTAQMTAECYARGSHQDIHRYLLEVIKKMENGPSGPDKE